MDEAQEQEDNETMLAYFFMWRGQQAPVGGVGRIMHAPSPIAKGGTCWLGYIIIVIIIIVISSH